MCFVLARIWNQEALVDVRTSDTITFPAFRAFAVVTRLRINALCIHSIASSIVRLTFIYIKASFSVAYKIVIKKSIKIHTRKSSKTGTRESSEGIITVCIGTAWTISFTSNAWSTFVNVDAARSIVRSFDAISSRTTWTSAGETSR